MAKKKYFIYLLSTLIIILGWQLIAANNALFPSLLQILYKFSTNLVNKYVLEGVFYSIFRGLGIYLIVFIASLILALIANKYHNIDAFLTPILKIFRITPLVSIILILIVLVKSSLIPLIIVSLVAFPIIYESCLQALRTIDKELLLINKLDNQNWFLNIFKFYLPLIRGGIVSGILSSFGLAFKSEIMAEILIGSSKLKGIGILLSNYRYNLEVDNLISVTILIILIISIIEYLVKKLIKKI